MSSQFTTRLGLMKPQGADPFLRQDFLDTMAILDGSPGLFICTSTTRPAWTSAQAGRNIFETDLGRIINWTGSAWRVLNQYGQVSQHSINPFQTLGKNAGMTFSLGNFTTSRPGRAIVIGSVWLRQQVADEAQDIEVRTRIDGAETSYGTGFGPQETTRFAKTGGNSNWIGVPISGVRSVTAGSHALTVRADVGAISNAAVVFQGAKAFVLMAE